MRKLGSLLAVAVLTVGLAVLPLGQNASGAQSGHSAALDRLWGLDRYETSLGVAQRLVAEAGGSVDAAVLVSGRSWQDAVVASGLAGSLGGPVLLTRPGDLPVEVSSFLAEAGVSQLVVVGSPAAVSDSVLTALGKHGTVERVFGPDPSTASVEVAQRMGTPGEMPGHGSTVVLANAEVFADAMVAGGFSARGGHPVLLTPGDALDDNVAAYLADSGAQHAVIMGGTAAVSQEVQDSVEALGVSVTRLGGSTRLHTAQVVAEFIEGKYSADRSGRCFDRATAGVATAWVPFDAFSAGPLLGRLCAPLLLTDPDSLDPDIADWIGDRTRRLVVFGGPAAVSAEALAAVSDEAPLEGLAAQQTISRARSVRELAAGIEAGIYGVGKDNVLRGPGGFEVSLENCPPFWSESEGITSDEIRIGHTTALTGDWSTNRNVTDGFESYLDWVNEHDPIRVGGTPRTIRLRIRDDRLHDLERTIAATEAFIGSDKVFSILTLGTRNTWVTYDRVNEACVPQPFVMSQHPASGDPQHHPWTSGMELSFSTEARLWGEWIRRNLADQAPVRVVGFVADNFVGQTWEHAFAQWASENPETVSRFVALRVAPDGSNLTGRITGASRHEPDVVIAMDTYIGCAQMITEVDDSELRASLEAALVSSQCRIGDFYTPPEGTAGDGWWIALGGSKNADDPQFADEPLMSLLRSQLPDSSLAQRRELFSTGFRYAYAYVEALRVAAALPGGLTRPNFMLATRTLDFEHPLYHDGIAASMNGNEDAYLIEGTQFAQYNAAKRRWEQVGDIVDINGQTPDCDWDYRAWLSGTRPRSWAGDYSNLTPRRFATISGALGEPRAYAAAYRATDDGTEQGTWCGGLPVNIRTGYWTLSRGSWCLFYDYQSSSWRSSDTGAEGYVQINGEAVLLRTGREIRLDHGDTLIVATYSGDNAYRCRLEWNRA